MICEQFFRLLVEVSAGQFLQKTADPQLEEYKELLEKFSCFVQSDDHHVFNQQNVVNFGN